ncbi:MAG: hypothetical protein QM811_26170 [Pirellulales bacterium]
MDLIAVVFIGHAPGPAAVQRFADDPHMVGQTQLAAGDAQRGVRHELAIDLVPQKNAGPVRAQQPRRRFGHMQQQRLHFLRWLHSCASCSMVVRRSSRRLFAWRSVIACNAVANAAAAASRLCGKTPARVFASAQCNANTRGDSPRALNNAPHQGPRIVGCSRSNVSAGTSRGHSRCAELGQGRPFAQLVAAQNRHIVAAERGRDGGQRFVQPGARIVPLAAEPEDLGDQRLDAGRRTAQALHTAGRRSVMKRIGHNDENVVSTTVSSFRHEVVFIVTRFSKQFGRILHETAETHRTGDFCGSNTSVFPHRPSCFSIFPARAKRAKRSN